MTSIRSLNFSAAALAAFLIVFAQQDSAQALDWSDAEWRGCPQKNMTGRWKARSHSESAPKAIWFQQGTLTLLHPNEETTTVAYLENAQLQADPYVELVLDTPQSAQVIPKVLRIRPHAVFPGEGSEGATCLIKVLRFTSSKNAQAGKYEDWNIYEPAGS